MLIWEACCRFFWHHCCLANINHHLASGYNSRLYSYHEIDAFVQQLPDFIHLLPTSLFSQQCYLTSFTCYLLHSSLSRTAPRLPILDLCCFPKLSLLPYLISYQLVACDIHLEDCVDICGHSLVKSSYICLDIGSRYFFILETISSATPIGMCTIFPLCPGSLG